MTSLELALTLVLGMATIGLTLLYIQWEDAKVENTHKAREIRDLVTLTEGMSQEINHLRSQPYILPEDHKVCLHCRTSKPLEAYPKDKYTTDGRRGECKPCWATYQREYRKAKKELTPQE